MKEKLLHIWQRLKEPLLQVALVYDTQLLR
jgi:hypothetical protein